MTAEEIKAENARVLSDFEGYLQTCRRGGMPPEDSASMLNGMKHFLQTREADAVIAEANPKQVTLSEIEREFIADMSDDNPPPEEPWRNFDPDYRQIDIARMLRRGWFERKIEGDYRSYRWTAAGRSALRAEREG